jgi:hypothetical protein
MTLLPGPSSGAPRFLCLRYYRAASTAWTFGSGCVSWEDAVRPHIQPFTDCVAPAETCYYKLCRRQPPTVKDMTSQFMFTLTCNADRLELSPDVTFQQYVYAFNSGRSLLARVSLPPSLPSPSTTSTSTAPYIPTTSAPLMPHGVLLHLECSRQS